MRTALFFHGRSPRLLFVYRGRSRSKRSQDVIHCEDFPTCVNWLQSLRSHLHSGVQVLSQAWTSKTVVLHVFSLRRKDVQLGIDISKAAFLVMWFSS